MPLRNLLWIVAAAIGSLVCFREADQNRYAAILSESIDKISTYYLEPIDHQTLFEGGMRGMMNELDPYSGFTPPAQLSQFKAEIEQHFGGIGIEVGIKNDRITVLNPVPDLPAYRAGMMAGDQIVAIDGTDVREATLDDAVKLMRGPIGTEVLVEVERNGEEETREFTLERAEVTIESVRGDLRNKRGKWSFQLQQDPKIGYIRLTSFGERSTEELVTALAEIDGKVDALIMDLRGNAGGLLTAAVDICDLFIGAEELVVSTRGRVPGIDQQYFSQRQPTFPPNKPLVVLVDRFTASAGEIFAACMQDYERGTIVGERTWGKGTVQNVIELSNGRGLIRLTTQSYWRPSGSNIHRSESATEEDEWGVRPRAENEIQFSTDEYRVVFRRRSERDLSAASSAAQDAATSGDANDDNSTSAENGPRDENPAVDSDDVESGDVESGDLGSGADNSDEEKGGSEEAATDDDDRDSSSDRSGDRSDESSDLEAEAEIDPEQAFPTDRQLDRAIEIIRQQLGEQAEPTPVSQAA